MANPFRDEPESRKTANPFRAEIERRGGDGAPAEPSIPVGDVLGLASQNFGSSGEQYWDNLKAMFTDPVGTAKGLGGAVVGGVQRGKEALGLPVFGTFGEHQETADSVGSYFDDRFGSWEGFKRAVATDPVGILADLGTVLTGGGGLLARAPALAGKVGRIAGATGRAVDPVTGTLGAAKLVGKGIGKTATGVLGMTTGTGPTAIRTAAAAGMAGGDLGAKFRAAMRGQVPMEEVVNSAKGAVGNLYQQRSQTYQSGMKGVSGDPTVLDFKKVDAALASVTEVKSFKGVPISESTAAIRGKIKEKIDQWRGLDPAEYHTVEGFDALKQSLGDILESAQYGTPEWKVANEAYQAVKGTITAQAPGYAKVMKDYTQATDLLQEIQKELSLGKKGNPATALRKLQSILRDDVSSAFGRRAELAGELEGAGARGLNESLAGQSMSSVLPRGLRGAVTSTSGMGAIGVAGGLNPATIGTGLAYALASSPRVVGEVAHLGGRVAGPVSRATPHIPPGLSPLAYQLGRAGDPPRSDEQKVARAGADYLMGLALAP